MIGSHHNGVVVRGLPPGFAERLAGIVGDRHVVTDPEVCASYAVDWTGRFRGSTPLVVRPGSVSEVAGVVGACADAGVAVVPQGGNTGLVGGSVPLHGEIVLSTRRLDDVGDLDRTAAQVTVGAGATLAALQRVAADAGLSFGVDLGARDTATVGGMAATNAGGLRLVRYGPMRHQVVGVEAVLGDGSVVSHLGGLLKDNTGYDLAGLLCGSEGTLGVICRLRCRLWPAWPHRVTAVAAVRSVADAVTLAVRTRDGLADLEAAELMLADGMRLVCDHLGVSPPLAGDHPAFLLVEAAGPDDPTDRLADALAADGLVVDAVVADDRPRREALWRYREAHPEAIAAAGVPHKLDVTLPLGRLAEFCAAVVEVVAAAAPGARTVLFGHVADGNVHVNVLGAPDGDEVDGAVLELCAAMGGSISAEHGIGNAKTAWLHLNRIPAELAAFARIRRALDPAGILNPAVLRPPPGSLVDPGSVDGRGG